MDVFAEVLVTTADWKRVEAREVPPRKGHPIVGLDLGSERSWSAAWCLVDHYAPAAPNAISNEAAIRCAGHLAQQPADARASESCNILGVQFETSHATGAVSPLRASGAMALLSPYKVRRGGSI